MSDPCSAGAQRNPVVGISAKRRTTVSPILTDRVRPESVSVMTTSPMEGLQVFRRGPDVGRAPLPMPVAWLGPVDGIVAGVVPATVVLIDSTGALVPGGTGNGEVWAPTDPDSNPASSSAVRSRGLVSAIACSQGTRTRAPHVTRRTFRGSCCQLPDDSSRCLVSAGRWPQAS